MSNRKAERYMVVIGEEEKKKRERPDGARGIIYARTTAAVGMQMDGRSPFVKR